MPKRRIQVTLDEDIISELDDVARCMGLSRSDLCRWFIIDKLLGEKKKQKKEPK